MINANDKRLKKIGLVEMKIETKDLGIFYKSSYLKKGGKANNYTPYAHVRLSKLHGVQHMKLRDIEWKTLMLLLRGRSAKEISNSVNRGQKAVEYNIKQIKLKLACSNRAELFDRCCELRLVEYFKKIVVV